MPIGRDDARTRRLKNLKKAHYKTVRTWGFDNMDPEEARKLQSKGGKAAAEKKKYAKSFKQALEWVLDEPAMQGNPTVNAIRKQHPGLTNRDAMVISMVKAAIQKGDVKAFTAVRDTTGELPVQTVNVQQDKPMRIEVSVLDDADEDEDEDE